jgi:pyrrolidone-carboxylate peptidase
VKKLSLKSERFSPVKKILPVSWKDSIFSYKKLLSESVFKPELVILLGIHSSKKYHLEKFGWNFKIGIDIENNFKFGPIKVYSPPLIKTKLNLKNIYQAIKEKTNISISSFAGLYLCNYLYYWALHLSNKEYPVVFIHIPSRGLISECINKVDMVLNAIIKTHFKEDL